MKKSLTKSVLILALAFIIAFSFSSFAFADGWLSKSESINLDTTYEGYRDYSDNYEVYEFTIPAKGTVTFHLESESKGVISANVDYEGHFDIYSSKNVDEVLDKLKYSSFDIQYSSARGVYYRDDMINLSKGSYYFVTYATNYSGVGSYEFSINYKPNVSSTSITKLTGKKKAFLVKYKKSGTATGYQIKYSLNKSMKNAKKVKTTKLYRTIKNLKKGKRYYVKVRAYRKLKVNGVTKTYYSKWSARKSVKTN